MSNRKSENRNQKKAYAKIFVVSGPSGSGKTTLAAQLAGVKAFRNRLLRSVSFTTRRRRPGEKEGRDYFFISKQEFEQWLKERKVLEWTRYLDYYYGTPLDFVERHLREGKHLILCLDLKGARRIKRFYPKRTVTIFILPPTLKALRGRIEGRCRMQKKELEERLNLAVKELESCRSYDYTVVNNSLPAAIKKLARLIKKEIAVKAR